MEGLQSDYDIKIFSMDDIDDEFKRLGYKGEMALKDQGIDSILGNYRKVLLESDQFVEMLE